MSTLISQSSMIKMIIDGGAKIFDIPLSLDIYSYLRRIDAYALMGFNSWKTNYLVVDHRPGTDCKDSICGNYL